MNHHPSYLHTIKWDRCDDDDDGNDNGHHRRRLAFELATGRNYLDLAGPAAPRSLHAAPGTAIPKADEPFCARTWCWSMDENDENDGNTAAQPGIGSGGPLPTTTIRLSKNSVTAMTFRSGRGIARFTVQFDDIEGSFTYERTEKKEKPAAASSFVDNNERSSERRSTGDDSQETVAMGSSLQQQQQQQRLSQLSTQSFEQQSATAGGGSSWGMTSQFAVDTGLATQMDDGEDDENNNDHGEEEEEEKEDSQDTTTSTSTAIAKDPAATAAAAHSGAAADRSSSVAPTPGPSPAANAAAAATTGTNDVEDDDEEEAVGAAEDSFIVAEPDRDGEEEEEKDNDGSSSSSSDTDATVDPQTATDLVRRARQSRKKEEEEKEEKKNVDDVDDDDEEAVSRTEYFTAETSDFASPPVTPAKPARGGRNGNDDYEEEEGDTAPSNNNHGSNDNVVASPSILRGNHYSSTPDDQMSVDEKQQPNLPYMVNADDDGDDDEDEDLDQDQEPSNMVDDQDKKAVEDQDKKAASLEQRSPPVSRPPDEPDDDNNDAGTAESVKADDASSAATNDTSSPGQAAAATGAAISVEQQEASTILASLNVLQQQSSPETVAPPKNIAVQQNVQDATDNTCASAPPSDLCYRGDDDEMNDVDDSESPTPSRNNIEMDDTASNEKGRVNVETAVDTGGPIDTKDALPPRPLEAPGHTHHKVSVDNSKAADALVEAAEEMDKQGEPDDDKPHAESTTRDVNGPKDDDGGDESAKKSSSIKVAETNNLAIGHSEEANLTIVDFRPSHENSQTSFVAQAAVNERPARSDIEKHGCSDVVETTEPGASLEKESVNEYGDVELQQQQQIHEANDSLTCVGREANPPKEEDKGKAGLEDTKTCCETKLLSHNRVSTMNAIGHAAELENENSQLIIGKDEEEMSKVLTKHDATLDKVVPVETSNRMVAAPRPHVAHAQLPSSQTGFESDNRSHDQGKRKKKVETPTPGNGDASEEQSKQSLAVEGRSRRRKNITGTPTDLPPLPPSRTRTRKTARAAETTDTGTSKTARAAETMDTDLDFPDDDKSPEDSPVKRRTKPCDSVPKSNGRPTRKRVGNGELEANEAIELVDEKRSASKRKASDSPGTAASPRKTPRKRTSGTPSKKTAEVRILVTGVELTKDQVKMVAALGGEIVDDLKDAKVATHVIAAASKNGTIRRRPKLMIALCRTTNVVSLDWLKKSSKQGSWLPCDEFWILNDRAAEETYNFSMKETLQLLKGNLASQRYILDDWNVLVCDGVAGNKAPSKDELKCIVEATGATWVTSLRGVPSERLLILTSDPEMKVQTSKKAIASALQQGATKRSITWFFEATFRQQTDLPEAQSNSFGRDRFDDK